MAEQWLCQAGFRQSRSYRRGCSYGCPAILVAAKLLLWLCQVGFRGPKATDADIPIATQLSLHPPSYSYGYQEGFRQLRSYGRKCSSSCPAIPIAAFSYSNALCQVGFHRQRNYWRRYSCSCPAISTAASRYSYGCAM